MLILRASVGLEKFTDAQKAAADINGDGKVKADDALIALRISVKLDSIDKYIKDVPAATPDSADKK